MPAKKDDEQKKGEHPEQQMAEREEKKAMRREREQERDAEKPEGEEKGAGGKGPPGRKKPKKDDQETAKRSLRNDHFPIVGIGASAGGLRALQGFFSRMETDARIAFVVIQHQDPKRQSMMPDLLRRYTRMPVVTAEDGMAIEADHVYLKPPEKDLVVEDRSLHLVDPPRDAHSRLPIDTFFRALAADQKEKAICIILSGAGSDGSQGLKEIKAEGGMVMVQSEEQAEYDSMPRNAIDTGLVDYILAVERMPEELVKYIDHPFLSGEAEAAGRDEDEEGVIRRILIRVRQATGHDFYQYKRNTIRRRIQRRMAVNRIGVIEDYARYLRGHPNEVQALFKDLVINVTNFFREPESFEALQEQLKGLIEAKPEDESLRVWVPGCATGEEAYSIAMLLVDEMEEQDKFFNVKIFATDINAEAIETAREEEYPENIAADLTPERLRRFFSKTDETYRVDSKIREMVIFAVHDIGRDPPFSRLDLVSFRNVLIYMDLPLQKRVLPILHYSLQPGGLLFLGSSEGIAGFDDLFDDVDRKHKIYRAREADPHQYLENLIQMPTGEHIAQRGLQEQRVLRAGEPREASDLRGLTERALLQSYGPPSVLIDENHQAVYFQGETHHYLSQPPGEPSFYILHMTRGAQLHHKLTAALAQVSREKQPVAMEEIHIPHNADYLLVDAVLRPLQDRKSGKAYYLLTFENERRGAPQGSQKKEKEEKERAESAPKRKEKEQLEGDRDRRVAELEARLQRTQQDLQATMEEMETSNEELKSANEELQTNNEELQSTNEELESSKEELQSTNEELETVNAELEKKNEELSRAHDDLTNLFSAADIGTLFLDTEQRINRYTPDAAEIFNLREQDLGRPIGDITSNLDYANFGQDVEQVLDDLEKKELEVRTKKGRWLSVRIAPYRTSKNVIAGAVATFVDVTRLKEAEQKAHEAWIYADSILETISVPLLVLGEDLKVTSANRAFYETFQLASERTEGRSLWELGDGHWDHKKLRQALEQVIPEQSEIRDYEIEQEFPRIGKRKIRLNARQVARDGGRPKLILLSFEDIADEQG